MGRIRDAINARRPRDPTGAPTFGAPAGASAIVSAEAALGLSFPAVLRELYQEFDGLWFGEPSGRPFPLDESICYFVLPLRLLPVARDILVELYGREGWVARNGSMEGYDDFEVQLSRCVPFQLVEGGASFLFLTDRDAWGIEPGRVGRWEEDGGPSDAWGLFLEYLADRCRDMSRG
ncbi:MAG: SMI1/KNR4 family protein [Planctomycetes bacterium]|nr:SMI1/KNR4 family protein [Planctomycetota bacterium]